jgi:uncharacterized repeat protein (TIGR01451 family)
MLNQNLQKRLYAIGAVCLTIGALVPLNGKPLLAQAINASNQIAQTALARPQLKLNLRADRQFKQRNAQGQTSLQWQTLDPKQAAVLPGDVVRYTLSGTNTGKGNAKTITLTQAIPPRTVLIPNTVTVSSNTTGSVSYSVDNGKTFSNRPTIQVKGKPEIAPTSAYTHLRITLNQSIAPQSQIEAQYQVTIK